MLTHLALPLLTFIQGDAVCSSNRARAELAVPKSPLQRASRMIFRPRPVPAVENEGFTMLDKGSGPA